MSLDDLDAVSKVLQLASSGIALFGYGCQSPLLMNKAGIYADTKGAHLQNKPRKKINR